MTRLSRRVVVVGGLACVAGGAVAAHKVHEVRITGFAFVPERLQVRVGDKVRWINDDLAPHTATADAEDWDTGELGRGASGEIVVEAGLSGSYFCVFHPQMRGALVVS